MSAGLILDASVEVGGFSAHYSLAVQPGEVLAVLGPNGAGKSTLLRAIAGLVPLSSGSLHLDGQLAEQAPGEVRLSARQRGLGVVFQDYVLFAHLSALDNVAFGLRARGTGRGEARVIAAEWLERLGISGLAARRPGQLSGGQAQKVALARALATSPRVLLLDEPLAALDVESRSEVRAELRRVLEGFAGATLVVTHDPADAAALADRIAIVERGAVTQIASPGELAAGPASVYVAALVGRTGFEVTLSAPNLAAHDVLGEVQGRIAPRTTSSGVAAGVPATQLRGTESGERMFASIRSDLLELRFPEVPDARGGTPPPATGQLANTWQASIVRLERDLGFVTVTLLVGDTSAGHPQQPPTRLTARLPLDAGARFPGGLREGQALVVHLPPTHVAFAATR